MMAPRFDETVCLTSPADSSSTAAGQSGVVLSPAAALEADLRARCLELDRQLRQDPVCFENEALEVQLVQMQDDFASLQEDFGSMSEYFSQRLADTTAQLEAQNRAATTAEGHADCLRDLLRFHEEQGSLVGSYWRTQGEKRDDSIRFLTLKLQEYTVHSSDYQRARQLERQQLQLSDSGIGNGEVPSQKACPASAVLPGQQHPGTAYQALLEAHTELCQSCGEQEDENIAIQKDLAATELRCAALLAVSHRWRIAAGDVVTNEKGDEASFSSSSCSDNLRVGGVDLLESEPSPNSVGECVNLNMSLEDLREYVAKLRAEVAVCDEEVAAAAHRERSMPGWAHRCTWRDELDVRAGQLERISLQFDATKRSLDAANEELQWQATSAEALRIRLSDVLRAARAEEHRTKDLQSQHQQVVGVISELVRRWSPLVGLSASTTDASSGTSALRTSPRASGETQLGATQLGLHQASFKDSERDRMNSSSGRVASIGGAVPLRPSQLRLQQALEKAEMFVAEVAKRVETSDVATVEMS